MNSICLTEANPGREYDVGAVTTPEAPPLPATCGGPETLEPDLARTMGASLLDDAPEWWLGELVLEVQKASDRAVGLAREKADSVILDARSEAISIREAGRRRVHELSRVRALIRPDKPSTAAPRPSPCPELPRPPVARSVGRQRLEGWNGPEAAIVGLTETGEAEVPPRAPPPCEAAVLPPGAALLGSGATAPGSVAETGDDMPAVQPPGPRATYAIPTTFAQRLLTRVRGLGLHPVVAVLSAAAIMVAVVGLFLFEHYATAGHERASQRQLAAQLADAEAKPVSPLPASGAVLGLLNVPRLALSADVIEGATTGHLRQGPAHDSRSPFPGHGGAVIIVGHRQTYGGPFGQLGDLRIGDVISLRTPANMYVYRVSRLPQVLSGSRATLQLPSSEEVRASGVASGSSDESLVLATSAHIRGNDLQVVVATLYRAGLQGGAGISRSGGADAGSGSGGAGPGGSATVLRSVPGDRVALLMVLWWLTILGGGAYLARKLKSRLAIGWIEIAGTVVAIVAVYQVYLAVDRLLPGTY
jgi:LPXTG-site transpeptidase (sortase) family protein